MSDTNTPSGVSLYDKYNHENGNPLTTFFPVVIDDKALDKVNPNGTSGAIVVDEALAASISPDDIEKAGAVTLIVGVVPKEKVASAKKMISDKAKASGGIGLEEGGVVAYNKEKETRKKQASEREQEE